MPAAELDGGGASHPETPTAAAEAGRCAADAGRSVGCRRPLCRRAAAKEPRLWLLRMLPAVPGRLRLCCDAVAEERLPAVLGRRDWSRGVSPVLPRCWAGSCPPGRQLPRDDGAVEGRLDSALLPATARRQPRRAASNHGAENSGSRSGSSYTSASGVPSSAACRRNRAASSRSPVEAWQQARLYGGVGLCGHSSAHLEKVAAASCARPFAK